MLAVVVGVLVACSAEPVANDDTADDGLWARGPFQAHPDAEIGEGADALERASHARREAKLETEIMERRSAEVEAFVAALRQQAGS